jgi:hypothetical protein
MAEEGSHYYSCRSLCRGGVRQNFQEADSDVRLRPTWIEISSDNTYLDHWFHPVSRCFQRAFGVLPENKRRAITV